MLDCLTFHPFLKLSQSLRHLDDLRMVPQFVIREGIIRGHKRWYTYLSGSHLPPPHICQFPASFLHIWGYSQGENGPQAKAAFPQISRASSQRREPSHDRTLCSPVLINCNIYLKFCQVRESAFFGYIGTSVGVGKGSFSPCWPVLSMPLPFIIRSPRSLAHCCLAGFGAAGHVGR